MASKNSDKNEIFQVIISELVQYIKINYLNKKNVLNLVWIWKSQTRLSSIGCDEKNITLPNVRNERIHPIVN